MVSYAPVAKAMEKVQNKGYKKIVYKLLSDRYIFYLSENGVWLVEKVPVKYPERAVEPEELL